MSEPILLNNPEEWDFTDYIDSLIQKDEAVDLEFKSAKNGLPNSLWDTYCSFANTNGGTIVLGVKEHNKLITLATCYAEGGITNDQLQFTIAKHSSDITKMLKSLCQEGYLTSTGNGRGTKYHICNPQKVESSEQIVVSITAKKNLRFNELQAQIVSIAVDYISLEEIATNVNKSIQYLINKIIPRMIEKGSIERLYPGTPNHPKQKYRATPSSSFNN